jgi:hypothetical protein
VNLTLSGGVELAAEAFDDAAAIIAGGSADKLAFTDAISEAITAMAGGGEADFQFKSGIITRNLADANGTITTLGLGFDPSAVEFDCCINGLVVNGGGLTSKGVVSGTAPNISQQCQYRNYDQSLTVGPGFTCFANVSSGNYAQGTAALVEDGFSLTWVKVGSPTGTLQIWYKAWR